MIREKSHSSKRLLLEEIDRAELELVRGYRKTLAHVNENENEMYDWDLNDLDFTAPFQLARGIVALEICREMAHGKTFSELTERNGKVIEALLCGVVSPQRMLRKWLLDIRKCKKLSQAHIAQLSVITQSAYARIEIGSRDPSVRVAKQIGKILDFPWTKFFE